MKVYGPLKGFTDPYTGLQTHVEVYGPIKGFTDPYTDLQTYIQTGLRTHIQESCLGPTMRTHNAH